MKHVFYPSVVIFLLLPSSSLSKKPTKWDFFTYVQEWPSTVCALYNSCHKVPANVTGWTVHGLWPSDYRKMIHFCNDSWPFQWDKIKVLKDDLQTRWPDLLHKGGAIQPHKFWQDEWEKHGTCATSVPATGSEFLYFKKSLDLNRRFNITSALLKSKIVPSCRKNYRVCDIQKALRSQLKLTTYPKPAFKTDKTGRNLLLQVEICLNKSFRDISCFRKPVECEDWVEVYIYPEHGNPCP